MHPPHRLLAMLHALSTLAGMMLVVHSQKVCPALADDAPQLYTYEVLAEYPHDSAAFTQGFQHDVICDEGSSANCTDVYYESTGMNGESSVRVVDLESGEVRRQTPLEHKWFGEGLTRLGDRLYQITWQTPHGFIYSAHTLEEVGTFQTPLSDGWGMTGDGELLVLSDGSNTLTWVHPETWQAARQVVVRDRQRTVGYLNELEMVEGEVWANIWQTECIARINPETGAVTGWVLLHGLRHMLHHRNLPLKKGYVDVLNGIAYDAKRKRVFVTGKYWPQVYEIKLVPVNPHTKTWADRAKQCLVHE